MAVNEAQMTEAIRTANAAFERQAEWVQAERINENLIFDLERKLEFAKAEAAVIADALAEAERASEEADRAYSALAREFYADSNLV